HGGTLPVIATWQRAAAPAPGAQAGAELTAADDAAAARDAAEREARAWRAAPAPEQAGWIEAWLRGAAARLFGAAAAALAAGGPLTRPGMDSLRAVELRGDIERATGVALPIVELFRARDVAELAAAVAAHAPDAVQRAAPAHPAAPAVAPGAPAVS